MKNKAKKDYKISRKIVKTILNFLVIIVYRPKKIGEENIPEDEGVILCSNHVHALDAAVLVLNSKRQICFMAKKELFKNPMLKWLAKIFGIFPVQRGKQDIEAMKNALKVIKDKKILGIFPEGTRNGLAKHQKVKNGAAYFALSTGAKVVPVAVKGSFKPFTKVTVTYCEPLDFSHLKAQKSDKEVLENVTNEIMETIQKALTNS